MPGCRGWSIRRPPGRQPVQRRDRPGPARAADGAVRPAGRQRVRAAAASTRGGRGHRTGLRAGGDRTDHARGRLARRPGPRAVRLLRRGHRRLAMDRGRTRALARGRRGGPFRIAGRVDRHPATRPILAAVSALRAAEQVLVSYDPNVRPSLLRSPSAARPADRGRGRGGAPGQGQPRGRRMALPGRVVARRGRARWLELGAVVVVITDGGDGAHGFTASRSWTAAGPSGRGRRHGRGRRRVHVRAAGRTGPPRGVDADRAAAGPARGAGRGRRRGDPGVGAHLRTGRRRSAHAGGVPGPAVTAGSTDTVGPCAPSATPVWERPTS